MSFKKVPSGFELNSGLSWKSWGEVIRILYVSEDSSGFRYDITISLKVLTTIVDYGKNLKNIQSIENAFEK